MLSLTTPLVRTDVAKQYGIDHNLSPAKREHLIRIAQGSVPWFVTLAIGIAVAAKISTITLAPPVLVCDPVFVAEMPGSRGEVLKIGHFDEVGGVMHVEI